MIVWLIADIASMFAVYSSLYVLRTFNSPMNYGEDFWFIWAAVGLTVIGLYLYKVYHTLWSKASGHNITRIVNPVLIAGGIIFIVNSLMNPRPLPESVIILATILNAGILITTRYRERLFSGLDWRWRAVWRGEFPRQAVQQQGRLRVLIIGAGEAGSLTAMRLMHRNPKNKEHNYEVVGFIDDDPNKQSMLIENAPVLGTRKDIEAIATKHEIDLIIVAIHSIKGADMRAILSHCERTEARIKIIPDMFAVVADHNGNQLRDVQPEDLLGRSSITRHEAVDLSPVIGKVVLITGAAGSIGSELTRQMMTYQPRKVIALDSNESDLHDLTEALKAQYEDETLIVPALTDVTRPEALRRVFEQYRPQVVFHAAAYKHVPMLEYYPDEAVRVNIGGTLNLVGLAKEYRVERFVLISTDKAVNPSSVMGASKRACELMIHAAALQNHHSTLFTAVRFGNVLGSRGSVVPTFSQQIARGGPVTITHRDMTRYFMTIPEAVNLVIHAGCMTRGDDIFILRMGEVVKIIEIAERMIRMRGLRPGKDIVIRETGVRPGEKMHEELHRDGSERLLPTMHPDITTVNEWDQAFDPDGFITRIQGVLADGLDTTRKPVDQLLDLFFSVGVSRSESPVSMD